MAAAAVLLVACSPALNWREVRVPADGYSITLPDKPQTVERQLKLPLPPGEPQGAGPASTVDVTMRMTSTGVGPTLFAVGVARLPPQALTPTALPQVVDGFREGLLRNIGGQVTGQTAAELSPAARGRFAPRLSQGITATGRIGPQGRPGRLAARFYVVDDRLYQIVAMGAEGELPAATLETFFDSFRLLDVP